MRDPYSLLGVKRNAGVNEIKAAFRTKAKSIHPDHNQDDPLAGDRFAEVGQAYELLKDPERRKRYDRAADMQQTIMEQRVAARQAAERAKAAQANAEKIMEELARANAQRAQANAQAAAEKQAATQSGQAAAGAAGATSSAAGSAASEPAEDMISRIFGPAAQSESQPQGQGQAHAQSQAHAQPNAKAEGAARTADAPHAADHAGTESGSDHADTENAENKPLPVLAVDLIASLVRRIRGNVTAPEKAPDLSVDATVTVADLLQRNSVTVKLPDEREVRVPLEQGMTEGQVVRLKGQGLKVPQMKTGDLLVNLKLAKDSQYRVDGFDLHTVLSVSLEDAVLGTDVSIETLDGPQQVTVPAWSGSDQTLRLEGLGLHTGEGTRGDLIIELRILLWEKPDPKVTDLMRHMRQGLFL
jgi:DnaJ-class molecular chaperone